MKRERDGGGLDNGMLIFGILFGLVVGGLATLLSAPKSGPAFRHQFTSSVDETGQNLRSTLKAAVPTDPVAESMAEGKAAARRRLAEMGH